MLVALKAMDEVTDAFVIVSVPFFTDCVYLAKSVPVALGTIA
jgi:hypothetical protein